MPKFFLVKDHEIAKNTDVFPIPAYLLFASLPDDVRRQ